MIKHSTKRPHNKDREYTHTDGHKTWVDVRHKQILIYCYAGDQELVETIRKHFSTQHPNENIRVSDHNSSLGRETVIKIDFPLKGYPGIPPRGNAFLARPSDEQKKLKETWNKTKLALLDEIEGLITPHGFKCTHNQYTLDKLSSTSKSI